MMNFEQMSRRKAEELKAQETVRILALETSCDETAAAVVENGRKILSNVVFSQIDLHELYGGVVPEIASRAHMEACDRVVDQALREAGMSLQDADALAVTKGPGLVGALLTGVNCMKGLAFAAEKPLVGVNHIEGHVSANYLSHPELEPPFLCLVVSGGHSHLVEVADYGVYRLLGQTVDDAAGEAFDKAARALGLPYPGGPRIDALAEEGNPEAFTLPSPKTDGRYDYSFSGLKTAFMNTVHTLEQRGGTLPKADLAASFRRAVCRELISKAMSMLVFLFYATRMDRPTVEVHDFTTWFLAFIYRMDTPINLFPSLHCLESWLCFRGAIGLKRMPRWYTWFQLVFTLLVFATVLLVKQHVWPDILGGVAFAELGQLLGRLFKADRLLAKTDRSLRSHA